MTDYAMAGQVSLFDQDTWCGKTYQEHSPQTKAKTSAASSKKRRGSSKKMPLFLDLRGGGNGLLADASWEEGGALLGEYTTHSFGECPKEENVSHLSQILEDTPLPKYYLSEKACLGILNRASKRGKELPEILKQALENQMNWGNCNS